MKEVLYFVVLSLGWVEGDSIIAGPVTWDECIAILDQRMPQYEEQAREAERNGDFSRWNFEGWCEEVEATEEEGGDLYGV